jgi:hypothetical protein
MGGPSDNEPAKPLLSDGLHGSAKGSIRSMKGEVMSAIG